MQLTITIDDRKGLLEAFNRAPATAAKEFGASLERIASTVTSHAIRNAPVGKDYSGGGNLRQSIIQRRLGNGYIITVNAAYGVFVDQGTRAHVIVPRRSRFLVFDVNGKKVFARRVNHPGTKPTHFFTNAVQSGQDMANPEMERAMGRLLDSLT